MKERLLKRFSQWEELSETNFDEVDSSALMESVKDDLEKLYNTKRGTVLIDDDFGLPDFSYMLSGYTAPDVGLIVQQLHLQTKQYEPRLHALHVSYVEQNKFPGKLQFQISAKMKIKDNDLPFNVYVLLGDDGSVSLNS
ncbi:MAG: type VI secretion system baseplate subunit TssE [Thiotrichaceae bacterium]|nr:MAG: type VI secretion system baseplate subunit TssE [Thiotrichaceae bacterium]